MMAVVAFALVAACGATYPGSELLGRWNADVRAMLAQPLAEPYTALTLAIVFSPNYTYSIEVRAIAAATERTGPGCTTSSMFSGGTWAVNVTSTGRWLTTGGTVSGTIERTGCNNAADNFARRAATERELVVLDGVAYIVSDGTLVFAPSGPLGARVFTR